MESEECRDEFGEAEAGGEDDDAAAGLFQEIADYVLVELHHPRSNF